ncbi:MAG TPA: phosphoribosylglycinamide formyltransferase [Candidatus Edwardsbacteria bacterium]|nr:phosphoribosylglycinamide formyltransferase [Candidatus Edwardsbacteria bacterium]
MRYNQGMDTAYPIACLVSGGGTNLQAIIDRIERGALAARIAAVVANVPDAFALERAKQHGLPAFVVDHREFAGREAFERSLAGIIDNSGAQLLCLCGFMRILTPQFIGRYPGRIINIHPALLPKYGGKGFYGYHVHQAVLAAGEKESGCTVHLVDAQVDHGPIILQRSVPVLPDDTPETLAARVLVQEHLAYPEAIGLFAAGRVRIDGSHAVIS